MNLTIMQDAANTIKRIFQLFVIEKKMNLFISKNNMYNDGYSSSGRSSRWSKTYSRRTTNDSASTCPISQLYVDSNSHNNKDNGPSNKSRNKKQSPLSDSKLRGSSMEKSKVGKYFTSKNLRGIASTFLYGKISNSTSKDQIDCKQNMPNTTNIDGVKTKTMDSTHVSSPQVSPLRSIFSDHDSQFFSSWDCISLSCVCHFHMYILPLVYFYFYLILFPRSKAFISPKRIASKGVKKRGGGGVGENRWSASWHDRSSIGSTDSGFRDSPCSSQFSETSSSQLSKEELESLKQKQIYKQIELNNKQYKNTLKVKKDSFVLLTQQAYCLISSQPHHANLFQVNYKLKLSFIFVENLICNGFLFLFCLVFHFIIPVSIFYYFLRCSNNECLTFLLLNRTLQSYILNCSFLSFLLKFVTVAPAMNP